mgnify:CR=1 FL=1
MFIGLLISWVGLVPYLTAPLPAGADLADLVGTAFRTKARFIGAGTIGVAAIWTLLKILGPIVSGIRSALAANAARKSGNAGLLDITERDLPIPRLLKQHYGHTDLGIYANILSGGDLAPGLPVAVPAGIGAGRP